MALQTSMLVDERVALTTALEDILGSFEAEEDVNAQGLVGQALIHDGAYLAGGCFKNFLREEDPKDLDLFFPSETAFAATVKRFEDYGLEPSYTNDNCVAFHVYTGTATYLVELVKLRFGTLASTLEGFDLNLTQAGVKYDTGFRFVRSDSFEKGMATSTVWFDERSVSVRSMERLQRYASYGFTVPQEELELAVKLACQEAGCSSVPGVLPTFFKEAEQLAVRGGVVLSRYEASFARAMQVVECVLHESAHALEHHGTAQRYLEVHDHTANAVFKKYSVKKPFVAHQGIPPLVRLADLFTKASLDDEAGLATLALVHSGTLTPDFSVWSASTVMADLFQLALNRGEQHLLPAFLKDLMEADDRPLTLPEWQTFMRSPAFSFELSSSFYTTLFGPNTEDPGGWRATRQGSANTLQGKVELFTAMF